MNAGTTKLKWSVQVKGNRLTAKKKRALRRVGLVIELSSHLPGVFAPPAGIGTSAKQA